MAVRTADDYITNAVWVTRIKGYFDRVDENSNGTIEVGRLYSRDWITLNREVKPADPKVYENLRQVVMEHIAAMGVTPGKNVTKDRIREEYG